ncbi:hypothetical protein PFISCL1PPCAC_25134, partial [Pristionchus fissidentatus]
MGARYRSIELPSRLCLTAHQKPAYFTPRVELSEKWPRRFSATSACPIVAATWPAPNGRGGESWRVLMDPSLLSCPLPLFLSFRVSSSYFSPIR